MTPSSIESRIILEGISRVPRDFQRFERALEKGANMTHLCTLNLVGTTEGAKGEDWQAERKTFLQGIGLDTKKIFDPKKPPEEPYTLDDAENEATAMMDNYASFMMVSDERHGLVSNLETGWLALWTVLTGGKVFFNISDLSDVEEKIYRRSRKLILQWLKWIHLLTDHITTPEEKDQETWLREIAAELKEQETINIPPTKIEHAAGEVLNRVYVSGTSVKPEEHNATGFIERCFKKEGIEFKNSYVSPSAPYSEAQMQKEMEDRKDSLVSIHVITNDSLSLGAIPEVFWLALEALVEGRRFGLYIEETDERKLEDAARYAKEREYETPEDYIGESVRDAVKLRRSLRVYLGSLEKHFPDVIHVAKSPEELADWAAKEIK